LRIASSAAPSSSVRVTLIQRCEVVDARVVDEDVQAAKRPFCRGKQSPNVVGHGHVCLDGNRFAAFSRDLGDHLVSSGLAQCIVHDHRRTLRRQMPGNGGADPLGCPGDDGNLSSQLLRGHHALLSTGEMRR
jgi:hypothetical protein